MGRRRKLNKLPMTSMQVYEKFLEEQKVHKPRSWCWADYLIRSFSKMSYLEQQERDRNFYHERYEEASKAIEKYSDLIKQLHHAETVDEVQSILNSVIASNGAVDIARYNTTAKPTINLQ